MRHTKAIKRIAVMLLAAILVLGSSLTAFSATITQTNPKTTGVQLIGNTLLINEDHHNFYIWGKSLMIQCLGVTDVLPNNNTKLIDVQFNGNLYKGIEEVLIVKTQGKDDKIRLEEGSMIVTGITTPEQVQEVKNAIKNQPTNLSELKAAFINECIELGSTKNYIVGRDAVVNEGGAKVNPKSIEGTAELIGVDQTVQSSSSTSEEKKSEPTKEEKKVPTPTPTPTPKKCTHQYLVGDYNYIVCVKCGAANPECNGCTHDWNDHGYCHLCDHDCYHKFPAGMTGAPCSVCGYNPTPGPVPSPPPVCPHTYGYDDIDNDEVHECKGCFATFSHHYNTDGRCEDCGHVCTHGDTTTGTCTICGKVLSVPIGCPNESLHASLHIGIKCPSCDYIGDAPHTYVANNDISHKCSSCGGDTSLPHTYVSGTCTECEHVCAHEGITSGECPLCHLTIGACQVDHSTLCPGQTCTCGEHGTGEHQWNITGMCTKCLQSCSHPEGYTNKDEDYHECPICKVYETHSWTDEGKCRWCNTPCTECGGEGMELTDGCYQCGKKKTPAGCPDEANHSSLHQGVICQTCFDYVGTAPHHWTNKTGYCDECNAPCSWCSGEGAAGGCSNCGKDTGGCSLAAGHSALHIDQLCSECEYPGTVSHTWIDTHDGMHGCSCGCCDYHNWLNGICADCSATHDCSSYSDGKCSVCGAVCSQCYGYGELGGCSKCGKVEEPYVCSTDHSTFCQGTQCPECHECGDGDCNWEYVDEYTHKCSYCHNTDSHNWGEGYCLDCEGECPHCRGEGAIGGCEICDYE